MLDYIGELDPVLAKESYIREQRALALGKVDRSQDAGSPSWKPLSGRRVRLPSGKDCWAAASRNSCAIARNNGQAREAKYFLEQAIQHYERGMMLDLNDFFSSSNLARLYRLRGANGDEAKAQMALHATSAACERAIKRGTVDEWVRPTLLGVAFDLGDPDKAEELARRIEQEGADAWKLETTLASLQDGVALSERDGKARLQECWDAVGPGAITRE